MRLHNTLTRKVEEFKPQTPDEVTLYTCGPTVYNYYHIGNLRNAVFNDTLRRTLEASGLKVKHVMNITDVGHLVSDADEGEDKLEKGAAREGKTVWEVAEHYTEAFKRDMAAINVLRPSVDPKREKNDAGHDPYARATDFIPEQSEMVQALLQKGFAYQTKQAVYFDVAKLKNYGELSGQKLADKETAARTDVVTDPDKHHPQDFAVWFFTVGRYADHTMKWSSDAIGPSLPDGFPGWHLECSAIIHATLGDPIDIHTGGVDHIGTHHPNEMAQTEAAFGHPLAHFWVHNEFNLVDGVKMSKSKGNSYTLADVTDHHFKPDELRFKYLQSHYRSELNFTWDSLSDAKYTLKYIRDNFSWVRNSLIHQEHPLKNLVTDFRRFKQELLDRLQDDLDTPGAIRLLHQYSEGFAGIPASKHDVPIVEDFAKYVDQLLGISILHSQLTKAQEQLIAKREQARHTKDWPEADSIRQALRKQGIDIDDTPHGPRWRSIIS